MKSNGVLILRQNNKLNLIFICSLLLSLMITASVNASPANELRSLLQEVRQHSKQQAEKDRQRVATFKTEKDKQQQQLQALNSRLIQAESEGKLLAQQFEANETELAKLEVQLKEQSGAMTEVSSLARQTASELAGGLENSLVTAQFPTRIVALREIAAEKGITSLEQLELLWHSIQQEMTESAASVSFPAEIVSANGEKRNTTVSRIGTFTAVADGKYLQWLPETRQLSELVRQPGRGNTAAVINWEKSKEAVADIALDPTRGSVLSLLTRVPNWKERLSQGGVVGYIILALGLIGVMIAIWRLISLIAINRKIRKQMAQTDSLKGDNPLGRVLQSVDIEKSPSKEHLETMLDEAIIRETPPLERGKTAIKLLASIAPMLGLLGTIVGMIATFQSISLFGTSDPRLMADGISQALMTTLMGLAVAIPLLLLYSVIASKSRALIQILDEQSAGLIARSMVGTK